MVGQHGQALLLVTRIVKSHVNATVTIMVMSRCVVVTSICIVLNDKWLTVLIAQVGNIDVAFINKRLGFIDEMEKRKRSVLL